MTAREHDTSRWLYPLLTALLAVLLYGFEIHDHGRTLDDKVQRDRGAATLRYVATLDRQHLPPADLEDFTRGDRLYGPFGAATAVLLGQLIAPFVGDPATAKHLEFHCGLTLWFLLFFFCTMCLGRRLGGSVAAGVCAGLALLALPRVLGLATCNPSDLPAAGAASLWVLTLVRWLERPRWAEAALCCAALGAAAAVRAQNGALLLPVAACFVVPRLVRPGEQPRLPWRQLVAAPFLAYAFWIAFWPDFWHAPFTEPWRVVAGFLEKGERFTQGTLWFGEEVFGPKLYPLVYLAITTPLWILLPAALGPALLRRRPLFWGLLAWFAVSAGKHLSGLGNFGGIRHFLAAFCPLAVFAGCGLIAILRRIDRRTAPGFALAGLLCAVGYARFLHPYESSYFNVLAGGTRGAAGRFDMEPNGAQMLGVVRAVPMNANTVILIPGPADLVHQIALPEGLLVYELLPSTLAVLRDPAVRAVLAKREAYVVTLQDRAWGRFDSFLDEGVLQRTVARGIDRYPVGMAMLVASPAFYDRAGELFR